MSEDRANLRLLIEEKFQKRPCEWQVEAISEMRAGKQLITIAPTGSGKTLPLISPILLGDPKITIIISPLNAITSQISSILGGEAGGVLELHGSYITSEQRKFALSSQCRGIVLSPEAFMSVDFDGLLRNPLFQLMIARVHVDECHCIAEWASFRPEYRRLTFMNSVLPKALWYFTTATLTTDGIKKLEDMFELHKKPLRIIRLSNDRPNVQIIVREISGRPVKYQDCLVFLGTSPTLSQPPAASCIIFMNSKDECEEACTSARAVLASIDPKIASKSTWFHSGNSTEHAQDVLQGIRSLKYWWVFATDIIGLGADLPGISLAGQYGLPLSVSSSSQRLGRVGRSNDGPSKYVLIVPNHKKYATKGSVEKPIVISDEVVVKAEPDLDTSSIAHAQPLASPTFPQDTLSIAEPSLPKRPPAKKRKLAPADDDDNEESSTDHDVLKFIYHAGCYREWLSNYYSNGTSDQFDCSCDRCTGPAAEAPSERKCCSNCNPELLKIFEDVITLKATRRPAGKPIPSTVSLACVDFILDSLVKWSNDTARASLNILIGRGGDLVIERLSLETVARAAAAGLIQTPEDISKHIQWPGAHKWAESLLAAVKVAVQESQTQGLKSDATIVDEKPTSVSLKLLTPSNNTTEPRRRLAEPLAASRSASSAPKKRKCSKCGGFGHYGEGAKQSTQKPKATQAKENEDPALSSNQ